MTVNSFAFRLKDLLEYKKLTLQAVATALGVSRPAVHKWVKGGEIDYEKLRKLAVFLQVNWIWLRYGEQAQRELEAAEAVELPMTEVRRRYTAEIMESEARMKLAQEGARIVTWEWNLVADSVTYSSNVEAVYGWHIDSNESFWPHAHPDDIPMMHAIYEESIRTGRPNEFDFRMIQSDGSVRWISSRATPIREIDGRIVKMVGISMDNTARKLAEQSLQEQQARFHAVFELTREGMAVLDANLRCVSANTALADMLGQEQAALLEGGLAALFQDRGARLRRMVRGRPSADFSARLQHADGHPRDVAIRALFQQGGANPAYYVLAVEPASA